MQLSFGRAGMVSRIIHLAKPQIEGGGNIEVVKSCAIYRFFLEGISDDFLCVKKLLLVEDNRDWHVSRNKNLFL